jgi:hypothetical protein
VHLRGGPAPVRRFLPELIDLIWNRTIDPGKVFDLTLPLEQATEGYRAMDARARDQGAADRLTARGHVLTAFPIGGKVILSGPR